MADTTTERYINATVGMVLHIVRTNNTTTYYQPVPNFEIIENYIMTIIYVSVFVVGWVGNLLTCTVILIGPSMRTTLNYYLFNLAIADTILVTLNVLIAGINLWTPEYNVFQVNACFFGNYAAEIALEVSMLTITGLTIERHQAIRNPFAAQSKSRAIKIIIGLWIAAAICSYFPTRHYIVKSNGYVTICLAEPSYELVYIYLAFTFIFFVIPMLIIIALYISIGMVLIKSSKVKRDMTQDSSNRIDPTTKKSLQISIAVVVAFFVCFSPFYIIQLMQIYLSLSPNSNPELLAFFKYPSVSKKLMSYVMVFFYILSGAINPIIYSIVSKKFRNAFKETLLKISLAKKLEKKVTKSTL